MFSDSEWMGILLKLRELTEIDKIKWELEDELLIATVSGTIYMIGSADLDGVAPWSITIRIQRAEGWQDLDTLKSVGGIENDWDPRSQVTPLRDIALRMALGGPQLASRLLGDLDKLDESAGPSDGDFPF